MAFSSSSSSIILICCLLLVSMAPFLISADQFAVGGEKGWAKPTGNDSETYNDWASQHRFHVGDEALFKYQNDSVLVVTKEDYENCITSNPVSKFEDGNTVFEFDHFGFFYFISGQPGHCKSGQRLIIRVMVHSEVEPPRNAATAPPTQNTATPPPKPAEEGGGGGHDDDDDSFRFGPPGSIFSGSKMVVASSCFLTASAVVAFVILCLFV